MPPDASPPEGGKSGSRFKPQSFRARHRARAHEDAHADGEQPDAPVRARPLVPGGPPQLVTRNDELAELLTH
ncbi:MAG TPA: hypothetical protein VK324_05215, partial [Tepidisphaeraceae bacterium]|nr:hypothetical protein [Tepidisphaeraceae bacterium]